MIDFRSIHLDHQVILMDRRIQPGKFRLVTHIISYFFFNYIHQILVHCHSACFCNRHPFNLLLHCFLCIFIEMITDIIDCLPIFFVNVFHSVFVYTIWICENIRYVSVCNLRSGFFFVDTESSFPLIEPFITTYLSRIYSDSHSAIFCIFL